MDPPGYFLGLKTGVNPPIATPFRTENIFLEG